MIKARTKHTVLFATVGALLLGSLLQTGPAQAAPAGVIQDFETADAVAALEVSVPGPDHADLVDLGTHGDHGVRFTVAPANTPESTASAGLTLNADTPALPVDDWSGHTLFDFDFFTDVPYSTVGRVTVRDKHGKAWGKDYPITARGWTVFSAKIPDLTRAGVDVSQIAYVGVSMPRGDKPITGYYDAVRLIDSDSYDLTPYADAAATSLLTLINFGDLLTGLDDQLDSIDQRLPSRDRPADQRLRGTLADLRGDQDGLEGALENTPLDYAAYDKINKGIADLEHAIPRLDNLASARTQDRAGVFGLESADSMELVHPLDLPFVARGTNPAVALARGESESVQAVVLPYAETLNDVRASITSVEGPDGKRADAEALQATVDPVGSLWTVPTGDYRRPTYTGWTPDPIRDDLKTVNIAAGDIQPYWIRLRSNEKAAAGDYQVKVRFTADGLPSRTMTVTATVWPITVPAQPELATAFQFTPWIAHDIYGVSDPDAQTAMTHQFWDFLADYKIQPDQIYTTSSNPSEGGAKWAPPSVEDVTYIRDHYGLKQFNALYMWTGMLDPAKPETWQIQIDKWLAQLDTAMADYRAAGVDQYAYVYGFDEVSGPMLEAARQTFAAVKERFPDLPIMTTLRDNSMGVETGMTELVDIWAPQQDLYDQSVAERTRARGDQAWWYPDIATGHPLPNWFNGYPPIDARTLMGPMSRRAGVEGVLYYATNRWLRADHANQLLVSDGIFSEWKAGTFNGLAGDGSLFYPGPKGPMASIRIENFRDGMEDYNLLGVLSTAIDDHPDADPALLAKAKGLLSAGDVVADQRDFSEDPATYRTWRADVAAAITALHG